MSTYDFTVVDIFAEPYAAAPQLTARLRIQESSGQTIHAIALRCQVRIEPQRRRYEEADESGLRALFGERDRWVDTLKPFLWMQCSAMVQGFTDITEVDLALPCTYDFEVTGSRYLHAVGEGTIPLALLFSGTVFTKGVNGFGVQQVPWDCEASYQLPISVWQQMIASYFPNTGWIRLDHDVVAALADFKARQRPDHLGRDRADAAGRPGRGDAVSQHPDLEPVRQDRIARVRAIADAVLYEGYLLYPYRASSSKNQSRWQFGVLGPPGAADESFGEDPAMAMQCLLEATGPGTRSVTDAGDPPTVGVRLRFLQLQGRQVEELADGRYVPVDELVVDGTSLLSWEEAVECEVPVPAYDLRPAFADATSEAVESTIEVPGGEDVEEVADRDGTVVGRIVRRRSRVAGGGQRRAPRPTAATSGCPSPYGTAIRTQRPRRTTRSACP